ncbi:hypothetical protein [Frateuria defendens]|uniref:hypothetical protein n=1 Tax=Frateuria defendens TaxID=2219559 RepID=UPI00066FDAB2|nr:hypothetical protein [Frateuria defendens]
MSKTTLRRRALVALLLTGFTGAALAATPPATGLGQSWPNAADVSANPHWHAYVFVLNGIKYVQINDLNGNVLGAVGTANGQFITLPVGAYSQQVSTPQEPATLSSTAVATASPTLVYQDDSMEITATPQSDGTLRLNALSIGECNDNPTECTSHIQ